MTIKYYLGLCLTLIVYALMPASARAAHGEAIRNGNGSVTLHGEIMNNSCGLVVNDPTIAFTLTSQQLRDLKGLLVQEIPFSFTLLHCQDTSVRVALSGGQPSVIRGEPSGEFNAFDQVPFLHYQIVAESTGSQGTWYTYSHETATSKEHLGRISYGNLIFPASVSENEKRGYAFSAHSDTATVNFILRITHHNHHKLETTPRELNARIIYYFFYY